MKLEILQENLNQALNLVGRILAAKPQLPILSHIHLAASEGKLTLTSSNQEITMTTETGAKVLSPGAFTVPGRTLLEIVSSLSAEKVTLELEGTMLTLKAGSVKVAVNGTPAAEYPSLVPHSEPKVLFQEIGTGNFQDMVAKTVFAAASDEGRAVLTGILFKPVDHGLTLAATDGFRLSVLQKEKLDRQLASSLLIPAKTLLEVARVLGEAKGGEPDDKTSSKIKVALFEESNQILFDLKEVKIYSALISGNFPDFEKIIPPSAPIKLILDADQFLRAVRLSSVFARESANIVKLQIANSKLKISANAPQVGENESEVEVKSEGKDEELSIAFNFHYLLDFLAAIGNSGEVVIELSGPTAPGVFRTASDPNFLHLIMPVRVQS